MKMSMETENRNPGDDYNGTSHRKPGNYQIEFAGYFRSKVIAYQPGFVEVLGSVTAAIMVCQLLYWHGKGARKGWIYKTIHEFQFETGLSRTQQDTAIGKLVEQGVLIVDLKGWPAKRHFKLMIKELHELISLHRPDKLAMLKTSNYDAESLQSNTESTDTRITTENTPVPISEDLENILDADVLAKYFKLEPP
jgi:hypothetical protein